MAKCETCGQELPPINFNKITHVMQEYVDPANGKIDGLYNNEAEFIEVKGKKLQEKGSYLAAKQAAAAKKAAEEAAKKTLAVPSTK